MDPNSDVFANPAVQELVEENTRLRTELKQEPVADPDVDLTNLKLPVIFKDRLIFKPGVHNGVRYTEDQVRTYWKRAENKPLFYDHNDSCANQTGMVKNVKLVPDSMETKGDLLITDEKAARNLLLGAKWGISPTIDYDKHLSDGEVRAFNPDFVSFSFVLDPAIRETMLNKKLKEETTMTEQNTGVSELLDLAIDRASAMEDESLLKLLKKIKDKYPKYPYPKEKMDALFARVDELEATLKKKKKEEEEEDLSSLKKRIEALEQDKPPESDPRSDEEEDPGEKESEEMEKLKTELEEKAGKLAEFEKAELEKTVTGILDREIELGITPESDREARNKELLEMSQDARGAVVAQLDKISATLEKGKSGKPKERATMRSNQTRPAESSLSSAEEMIREMKSRQGEVR